MARRAHVRVTVVAARFKKAEDHVDVVLERDAPIKSRFR